VGAVTQVLVQRLHPSSAHVRQAVNAIDAGGDGKAGEGPDIACCEANNAAPEPSSADLVHQDETLGTVKVEHEHVGSESGHLRAQLGPLGNIMDRLDTGQKPD
jgi:hypothetical protein